MKRLSNFVTINPYFKVHAGKMSDFKALVKEFYAQTSHEDTVLFYEFTMAGDEAFCREGYPTAEAALAHLKNVSEVLKKVPNCSDVTRFEIHGPASELAKMKPALAEMSVAWFEVC